MGFTNGIPTWGSHRPALEVLIEHYNVKSVLEMGIGIGSTPTFFQYDLELVTWESEQKWIDTAKKYVDNYETKKHKIESVQKENYGARVKSVEVDEFNLIFIDAHDRIRAINNTFGKCDIIVSHDCEEPSYGWKDIVHSPDYEFIEVRGIVPWTWVWIKKSVCTDEIVQKLKGLNHNDYYGNPKYKFKER